MNAKQGGGSKFSGKKECNIHIPSGKSDFFNLNKGGKGPHSFEGEKGKLKEIKKV